ncbi:hypothetical protein GQ44DRAFT_761689 [Phaeosphaeriaceae sp. PMI808]|nr:hypothetical protein GQ44DRAFT_761689 [Phaeosphaeriaceae sp. PMI808]
MPFTASDICKILLAIILPPLGVFLERGCNADFLINILLTVLGYIPYGSVLHAAVLARSESARQASPKMNFNASLAAAEIEALGHFEHQTLQGAAHRFEQITAAGRNRDESTFEKNLRIKNTLDSFEETSRTAPSGQVLAVLLNCECLLWRLTEDTPLRCNPFLSHWVEAVQRLDRPESERRVEYKRNALWNVMTTEKISMARVEWIKSLLQGERPGLKLDSTPFELGTELLCNKVTQPFHLQPFIRMLEDEGIYDKTPEPEVVASASTAQLTTKNRSDEPPTYLREQQTLQDSLERRKTNIVRNLKEQPETAIFEITRLPITLPYLDFLTMILADRTLEKHSIDPAPVITQYIQHALRIIERIGKPPSPPSELYPEWPEELRADFEQLEYGKEAQSRFIRLLLLFIKSLIRKGLIELDVLFYEIAEITVRYVWIKEVREFRAWAEEGTETHSGG